MHQKWMKQLTADVRRLISANQDDYAEILAMTDRDSLAFIEVQAVIAWAGFTPSSYMVAWALGSFDA